MDLSLKIKRFRKSGAGPPPIKTDKGWLFLFHVVTNEKSQEKSKGFFNSIKKIFGMHIDEHGEDVYSVWAVLLDEDNPEKVISKSYSPIFYPEDNTSLEGKKVIFPTGIIEDRDKKSFLIYSGEADKNVSVVKVSKKTIFNVLRK